MTAHDPANGPAHDSTPPDGEMKPKQWKIDSTGISMTWRLAAVLFGAAGLSHGLWPLVGVATPQALADHDAAKKSHLVDQTGRGAAEVAGQNLLDGAARDAALKELSAGVEEKFEKLEEDVHEDRAERLADKAAARYRNATRATEVWKHVYDQALRNLTDEKSIREALGDYLGRP